MHRALPVPLILFVIGAIVAGLSVFCPAWGARLGADIQALPELSRQLSATRSESTELDLKREALARRLSIRLRIASGLAAGRLTLLEAASIFRQLSADWPAIPDLPTSSFPGDSIEEQTCWQVIDWTYHIMLTRSAIQAEALRTRLEAELRRHLAVDRHFHLPAPEAISLPSLDEETNLRTPSLIP